MSQQSTDFLEALKGGDKKTAVKLLLQEALGAGIAVVEGDRLVLKRSSGKGRKCQCRRNKN